MGKGGGAVVWGCGAVGGERRRRRAKLLYTALL